jgi:hypothetical protein
LKHSLARVAGHKAIAINIWPDSSHLQDGRFRKVVPNREADGFLHSRLHTIGYQYDVKSLPVARLVDFLQAASGPHTVSGAFKPLQPQAQSGLSCNNQ